MKTTRSVRNWAYKGGWLFAVGYVIVILTAASMGINYVSAQTEPSRDSGSVLFDKTTDTIESYTDIPYSDDPKSSSYILYTFTTEEVIPKKENEIESLRTPNSYVYLDENNKETHVFYASDQMVMKNDGQWYQLEYGTTTIEKFYNEIYYEKPVTKWIIKSANAQTYAEAGDGRVRNTGANWNTIRTATTGNEVEYAGNTSYVMSGYSNPTYYIHRTFYAFNTSSLDETDCVDTAVLSSYVIDNTTYANTIYVLEASQAATNELVNDDFDNIVRTDLGNSSTFTDSTYTNFTLNSTGENKISLTGYTKLALMDGDDYDGDTPTTNTWIEFGTSEQAGTDKDPKLTITMTECATTTAAATSTPFSVGGLNYSWDLTIIAGLTEHYESTTTAPDWVEVSYYHIPFFAWLILFVLLVFIFSRIIIELLIRWRTK